MEKAIREFHNSINIIKIARQLSGKAATEVLILPTTRFEIQKWATIAAILFKPFKNDKARIKFVYTLAQLYYWQEMPQRKALKWKEIDFVIFKSHKVFFVSKQKKAINSFKKALNGLTLHTALGEIP